MRRPRPQPDCTSIASLSFWCGWPSAATGTGCAAPPSRALVLAERRVERLGDAYYSGERLASGQSPLDLLSTASPVVVGPLLVPQRGRDADDACVAKVPRRASRRVRARDDVRARDVGPVAALRHVATLVRLRERRCPFNPAVINTHSSGSPIGAVAVGIKSTTCSRR